MGDVRRNLPSVDAVLRALDGDARHPLAPEIVREVLAEAREAAGDTSGGWPFDAIVEHSRAALGRLSRPSLRPVINAAGVILQTNLGRAPLSDRAVAAMEAVARGYSNLEFDLEAGERGSRHEHVRALVRRTTGAEDGIAVNNNAAALLMVLQVLAQGREVIVSRGQAVEIGGGFRIPDVLRQSGARLVEVGTTNRTYAGDYSAAWSDETSAILRVHASNFRVVGFTAAPTLAELAAVAHTRSGFLFDDLGSGCLVATERYGIAHEPTIQESIAAGVDLALFSGDKLLGGPQCGIIAGRSDLVARLRAHPLARALRVDKLTIAALNATLLSYAEGREAEEIPVWRMVGTPLAEVRRRALSWARAAGAGTTVVESRTMVGGGSVPGEGVPTFCAAVRPEAGVEWLAAALRAGEPPVVGRVEDGRVLLDARTVRADEVTLVGERLRALLAGK